MAFNPESWGGNNTSKDYELFMEAATPITAPVSLAGSHAVTSPGQNLTDIVTERYVKKVGGRLAERERVIRPAEQLSLTFTLLFGAGLETPALVRARRGSACRTTFYAVRLCADPKETHAYIWPDAILNPPVRVNDAIQIEDTSMATWQTEMRLEEEILLKEVGAFEGAIEQNSDPYYAVAFFGDDCDDCGESTQFSNLIAAGGDGTAAMVVDLTTDRFATVTQPSTMPAPVGSVATSIVTFGENEVLVAFSDLDKTQYGEVVGPASGGTIYSADGGDNFTLDTNLTLPISAVGRFSGQWIAVGGADDSNAYVAVSDDGISWTQVVSATLPVGEAITDLSVDEINGKVYVTTQATQLFVGENSAGTIVFTEITTIPSPPAKLFSVNVLASDYIAIGGDAGFYAESHDGGATWVQPSAVGSGNILSMTGTEYRHVIGNVALYSRDVMTNFVYEAVSAQNGAVITGNVTGVASVFDNENKNLYAAVTDIGEPYIVRDFSPFSA